MLHHQFERELAHLELVFPLLAVNGPFALSYWRSRAAALSVYQSAVPSGTRRIISLLALLDRIEPLPDALTSSSCKPLVDTKADTRSAQH